MHLLPVYSKIQLKIEKNEEKISSFLSSSISDKERVEAFFHTTKTGGIKKYYLRAQLLFWKILRTLIRFFALLFGDSSENFMIFTNEYNSIAENSRVYDSREMLPVVSSTFSRKNPYCKYKKFQKRVRFYSRTAFVGIIICTIITTSILYFFIPGKPSSFAATFNWVQSDWSGGLDLGSYPNHSSNQTGWTKYSSKDDSISASSTLSLINSFYTATDDGTFSTTGSATGGGFSNGATSSTTVSGSGSEASIALTATNYSQVPADTINANDFVSKIRATIGTGESDGDYSNLSTWEAAIESDLTASTSQVFTVSDRGTYDYSTDDGQTVTFTGGGTGTLKHLNTSNKAYIISVSGTVNTGTVTVDSTSHTFTISDTGAQIGRAIAECYNDWPTGLEDNLAIDGWTTDVDNYIKVYAPEGQRHDGWTWTDTNKNVYSGFAIKLNVPFYSSCIAIGERYTKIDGLIIDINDKPYSSGISGSSGGGADNSEITNCIAFNNDDEANSYSGFAFANSGTIYMSNCLAYDCHSGFSLIDYTNSYIYNCTSIDNLNYGFNLESTNGSQHIKNCLSYNNTNGDFNRVGSTYTLYVDYSASSDGTADDWEGTGNRVDQTFSFVDETNDDFHLNYSDQGARDYGTSLSADPAYPIISDIDGLDRTELGTWDIGADEFKPLYETSGTFTSAVIDLTQSSNFDSVSWNSSVPANTSLALEAAVSDSAEGPWVYSEYSDAAWDYSDYTEEDPTNDNDFVCKIRASGGDYDKLSTWETAIESDLTASTSQVFTVSSLGTYSSVADDGQTVTFTGGGTGTLKHINTSNKAYIISVSGTVEAGTVTVDSTSHTFTISTTGTQIGRAIAECYNDWVGGLNDHLSIDGWTASADHYVKVYAPEGERHDGTFGSGFRMYYNVSWAKVIETFEAFTRISDLEITTTSGLGLYARWGGTVFDNMIIKREGGVSTSSEIYGIYFAESSPAYPNVVRNTVVYNFGVNFSGDWLIYKNLYNCTSVNAGVLGFKGGGSETYGMRSKAKNCVAYSETEGSVGFSADNWTADSTNNASFESSADDIPGDNSVTSVTSSDFADYENDDFHLSATSSLKNTGADLSSDANYPFTLDMDYKHRAGTWDIGADEYGGVSSSLSGRYLKYRATFASTDTQNTSSLQDITFSYSQYPSSATLISSPYDTSDSASVLSDLTWTESGTSTTELIKFQLRTAPDNSGSPGTWSDWMGPTGTDDYYETYTGSNINSNHTDGSNDQWIQYKVILYSGGGATPTLSDLTMEYVVNNPPTVSNVSASQGADGVISISYDLADTDSSDFTVYVLADIGITLNEELTNSDTTAITVSDASNLPSSGTIQIENEQISYTSKSGNNLEGTVTRGANNTKALAHSSGSAIWLNGTTVSGNAGSSQTTGTGKTINWTIKTDLDEIYYATAKIRVSANDGNGANQVGNGDSTAFVLDTKDPVPGSNPILVDASVSPSALTLDATDDSSLEMKISLNADLSGAEYTTYNSSSTITLESDPDTVYIQFKDAKGNTSSILSSTTPETPGSTMTQDTSNTGTSEWRLFVAWGVVTEPTPGFASYEVYRSEDNITYTPLSSITDRATNFYADGTTAYDTTYYYKIFTKDSNNNQSYYSSATSGKADGTQGDGEGGGGGDTTSPTITHNYSTQVTSIASTTATITFTTDELSDSYIGYSTDTSYTNEQGVPTMITGGENHAVTLVGLSENTTYHYKIKSRDPSNNNGTSQDDINYTFTTTTDTTPPVITFNSSSNITDITDSSAVISWTTDEAATSRIDYGTSTDYGSNEINANYNINHSITLTGLLPERTYYFKITSVDNSLSANSTTDDNSEAGYTFTTLASSDSTAPTISSVSSNSISYNSAAITWTTNESSSSLVDFGETTSYGTTQGNSGDSTTSHSITLSGLTPETTYYYQVKSMDIAGNIATDDNSEAGYTFTTTAAPDSGDTTTPVISNVLSSSITSTGATITWTTNESSDSTVGFSLDASFNEEQGSTTNTMSHNITLVNLAPETTYYYQVKSRDDGGNLATDNNSGDGYTFTTLAGGDLLAPIISSVSITDITSSSARVTWTTNENSNSLIDYSGTSGVFTSSAGRYQDDTTSHSVTVTGLDPSTPYYFQVRSEDASGNEGKDSNGGVGYTFTTVAGGDESAPEISDVSSGTPTFNSVTISWTTNELSNSLVDFGTTTSYGTTQGNSGASTTSHSVTLTGLLPETTYYYRVKSIDVSGNMVTDDNSGEGHTFTTAEGSNPEDETAPVITFDSETGVTNITSSSATISWTTDESSDSTVGYGLNTSFASEKGSSTMTTDHSVTLTNLSSGTEYKFQIKSMDASGNVATENNSGNGYTFTTLTGGDSTAPVISSVTSGTCTGSSCIITWATDENSSSLIDYGILQGTFTSTGGNYKDSTTSHSVTLTGLSAQTTYYYRVRSIDANNNQAIDSGGASGYTLTTGEEEASTCPTCSCGGGGASCPSIDTNPPTISNVKVSAVTTNSAVIGWETDEESDEYVEYGLTLEYNKTDGSRTTKKSHIVNLFDLKENSTYNYKVTSADSSGNLAQSENFTFRTLSFEELSPEEQQEIQENQEAVAIEVQNKLEELLDQGMDEETVRDIISKATKPPVISAQGPLTSNITNSSAKVSWATDRKSNSVIKFKIKEEGVNPEESSNLKQYGDFSELVTDHSVLLNNLLSGTTYQFQVQTSDILGNTGKSQWQEFTTQMTPSIYDVAVSEITLNSAIISWKTSIASTSKIEYGKTIDYASNIEDKDISKVTKHSIKLNNLESGTLYHYRIKGIDNEGNGLISNDYTFSTFVLPKIETYSVEKIDEREVSITWKTNIETDSVIKYTDTANGDTKKQGEDAFSSIHSFTLKGLDSGVDYELQIQGRDSYGNQVVSSVFPVKTLQDITSPEITQIKTETAVSSEKSGTVQTIISWKTNEPATSQIFWENGITNNEELPNFTAEDDNYTTNHIMVITEFKPSSVYRFRIQGRDKAGNIANSQDFTILIPEEEKSVIQIIISNFENTFGWVKKIGL